MSRTAVRAWSARHKKLWLEVLPEQGQWTEEAYLRLTEQSNRPVEFTDGYVEVLPVPTDRHQTILEFMFLLMHAFIAPRGGKVHVSGLRVRLRPGQIREPDLSLFLNAKDPRRQNVYWIGADLVVEVVSEDGPDRDLVDKRRDYAKAQIPEYWIVNPLDETILVYQLKGTRYPKPTVYRRGKRAQSVLLDGFSVDVAEVFDAE